MKRINWTGIQADMSICSIQDVIAKHLTFSRVYTLTVGPQGWDYARMDIGKWNKANEESPIAIVWNLKLEPSIDGHSWYIDDGSTEVFIKGV